MEKLPGVTELARACKKGCQDQVCFAEFRGNMIGLAGDSQTVIDMSDFHEAGRDDKSRAEILGVQFQRFQPPANCEVELMGVVPEFRGDCGFWPTTRIQSRPRLKSFGGLLVVSIGQIEDGRPMLSSFRQRVG